MSWECMCGQSCATRNAVVDHLRRAHSAKVVNVKAPAVPSSSAQVPAQCGADKLAVDKQKCVSGSSPVPSPSFKKQTPSPVSLSSFKTQASSAVSLSASQMQTPSPASPPSVKAQMSPIHSPSSFSRRTKSGKAQLSVPTTKTKHGSAESPTAPSLAFPQPQRGGSGAGETALRCSKSPLEYIPAAGNAVCNDHDYTVIEGQHLNLQLAHKRMGGSPWTHCTMATNTCSRDALATSGTFPTSGRFPMSRSAPTATLVLSKLILDEATKELIGLPPADVRRDQPAHLIHNLPGEGATEVDVLVINDIRFQYDVNKDIHCQYDVEVVAPDDYPYFVEMEKKKDDIFIMDDEHEVDDSLLEMTDIQVDTFCHEHGQVDGLNLITNLTHLQPLRSSCAWQVDGSETCHPEDNSTALEARFEQYRRRYSIGCVSANERSEFQQVAPGNSFSKHRAVVSCTSLANFGRVVSKCSQALIEGHDDISGAEPGLSQLDGSGSKRKKRAASKTTMPVKKMKQMESEEELVATLSVSDSAGMRAATTLKTAVSGTTVEAEDDVPPCGSSVGESTSSVVPKSPEERMAEHFQSCLDQGIRLSSRKTGPKRGLPRSDSTSKKAMTAQDTSPQPSVVEGNVLEGDTTPKSKEMMKGKGKKRSSADKTSPSPKRKKTREQATTPMSQSKLSPIEGEAGKERRTLKKKIAVERSRGRDDRTGGGKAPDTLIASSQEGIEQLLTEELDTVGNEEAARRNGIASSAQCIEQHPRDLVKGSGKKAIAQPHQSIAQHTTDKAGMEQDEEGSVEARRDAEQRAPKPAQTKAGRKGKLRTKKENASASAMSEIPTTIPPVSAR